MKEPQEKKAFWRGFSWGAALLLVLALGFGVLQYYTNITFLIFGNANHETASDVVSDSSTRNKLSQIANLIDWYYYGEVDPDALEEALYDALLDTLGDKYTRYYTASEYQSLKATTTGSYTGVGLSLTLNEETGLFTIVTVYEGGSAEEAGLLSGDCLLSADGESAADLTLSEFVALIQGSAGTSVTLEVLRGEETFTVELERREMELITVSYQMLSETIGYLQITEFSEVTADQCEAALEALQDAGMTALVIDLRDNPGGLLDSVCDVLDLFLPECLLVYTESKDGTTKEYYADSDDCLGMPLAVLVNENSASASEIFAGAIQDYEAATLIGTTTFGKGIVQTIFSLSDGSAVKITTANYYTPNGNYIHGVGITPDLVLEYAYLGDGEETDLLLDNQVLKAMEVLTEN